MTTGFQKKLSTETVENLEKKLALLYKEESGKLLSSIKQKCKENDSQGITQTIGRRFGYFWEEMVKHVFEHKFSQNGKRGLKTDRVKEVIKKIANGLKDILETGEIEIADFIYQKDGVKCALEIKWRIRWNDSKTVKSHCFAFHRLKDRGFEPIMPIRRPKGESFTDTIERFEKEGWAVLTGKETMDFMHKETGFDLESWIKSNVNFWKIVSPYQECLESFTLTPSDFCSLTFRTTIYLLHFPSHNTSFQVVLKI